MEENSGEYRYGLGKLEFSVREKVIKKLNNALAGVAQWIERRLWTNGSPARFPVRAHAWVGGQVPSGGHVSSNHTLMFLSLSASLPLSLKINKIKSFKKCCRVFFKKKKKIRLKYEQ